MNLNKVFVIGRVTATPELRSTPGGQPVSSFSVATNRTWIDKTGTKQEEVEFHNIVVWGKQAQVAAQYLVKGALVYIEGRLRTRSWQDKQSGGQRRTTEIICERIQLGPRAAGTQPIPQEKAGTATMGAHEELPTIDIQEAMPDMPSDEPKEEDLPF
jgi:single-strand DNA-binding protein